MNVCRKEVREAKTGTWKAILRQAEQKERWGGERLLIEMGQGYIK